MSNKLAAELADKIEETVEAFIRDHKLEPSDAIKALQSALLKFTLSVSVDGKELHALIVMAAQLHQMFGNFVGYMDDAETDAAESQKH
jgi:hypothetical protein